MMMVDVAAVGEMMEKMDAAVVRWNGGDAKMRWRWRWQGRWINGDERGLLVSLVEDGAAGYMEMEELSGMAER